MVQVRKPPRAALPKPRVTTKADVKPDRDLFDDELRRIGSSDELRVASAKKSSVARRSDLIGGAPRTALCFPRMRHLSHVRLVLKRFECRDELNLDLRRAECATFAATHGHPCIVRQYAHWLDASIRGKRILCVLLEEVQGDSMEAIARAGGVAAIAAKSLVASGAAPGKGNNGAGSSSSKSGKGGKGGKGGGGGLSASGSVSSGLAERKPAWLNRSVFAGGVRLSRASSGGSGAQNGAGALPLSATGTTATASTASLASSGSASSLGAHDAHPYGGGSGGGGGALSVSSSSATLVAVSTAAERIGEVRSLRYLHGVCRALAELHALGAVHGAVAPRNVFRSLTGAVVLDHPGRVQLEAHRSQAIQEGALLSSSKLTAHWAPELFNPEVRALAPAADVWSLALCIFEVATGQPAFAGGTRSITAGLAQWSHLAGMPRLRAVLTSMARMDPAARPSAREVSARVEALLAVEIQRIFRGWRTRRLARVMLRVVPRIQARVRGALSRKDYYSERERLAGVSTVSLAALDRSAGFSEVDNHVMMLQAILLRKLYTSAFGRFRTSVVRCQAFVRGMIARRWYTSVMRHRHLMENHLLKMHESKVVHKRLVSQLASHFRAGGLPVTFQHLTSFDDFEHALGDDDAEHVVFMTAEARLKLQVQDMRDRLDEANDKISFLLRDGERKRAEEEQVRADLGPKYPELAPMVATLTANLRRVADLCSKARTLPIAVVQHGSLAAPAGDAAEEETPVPFDASNMCESILQYNDRSFRADRPVIDLALHSGKSCFVSEVLLAASGSADGLTPSFLEIYVSPDSESWALISEAPCEPTDDLQTFVLPGEQVCSFLRIAMRMNTVGGSTVVLRYVSVKGTVIHKSGQSAAFSNPLPSKLLP